jgi:hypothetical protein
LQLACPTQSQPISQHNHSKASCKKSAVIVTARKTLNRSPASSSADKDRCQRPPLLRIMKSYCVTRSYCDVGFHVSPLQPLSLSAVSSCLLSRNENSPAFDTRSSEVVVAVLGAVPWEACYTEDSWKSVFGVKFFQGFFLFIFGYKVSRYALFTMNFRKLSQ